MTHDIPCVIVVTQERLGIPGIVLEELFENVGSCKVINQTSLYKRGDQDDTLFKSYFSHSLSSQHTPIIVFDAAEDPEINNNNKGVLVSTLEREVVDTASLYNVIKINHPNGDESFTNQLRKRVVILNIESVPLHVQKSIRVIVDRYMDRVQITFTTSSLSGVDAGLRSRAFVRPKMISDINICKKLTHQETARSLARKLIDCKTPKERGLLWKEAAILAIGESDDVCRCAEVIEMVAYIEHMCAIVHRRNTPDERRIIEAGAALFIEYTCPVTLANP